MKKFLGLAMIACTVILGSCSNDDDTLEEKKYVANFEYEINYSSTSEDLNNWEEVLSFQFNGEKAKLENEAEFNKEVGKDNFYIYTKESNPSQKTIKINSAETTALTINVTPKEVMEISDPIELSVKVYRDNELIKETKTNVSYTTVTSLTIAEHAQ